VIQALQDQRVRRVTPAHRVVAFAVCRHSQIRTTLTDGVIYQWTPPPGITHVMVEMWGAGGGGGGITGGGGGGYSRRVVPVTPGLVYTITVGGGGLSWIPFSRFATDGSDSIMRRDCCALVFAGGGGGGTESGASGLAGLGDESATIFGHGGVAQFTGGAPAFGANFCPNGNQTGKGGDIHQGGQPGYVLLVW
jgi:hypothetical protein